MSLQSHIAFLLRSLRWLRIFIFGVDLESTLRIARLTEHLRTTINEQPEAGRLSWWLVGSCQRLDPQPLPGFGPEVPV
jgi:hypothetical protein